MWSSVVHHHHALYVGHHRVIHVFGGSKLLSRVREDSLADFRKDRVIRRARYGRPWWELYVKAPGTVYDWDRVPGGVAVARARQFLAAQKLSEREATPSDVNETQTSGPAAENRTSSSGVTASSNGTSSTSSATTTLSNRFWTWKYHLLDNNCESFVLKCTAADDCDAASAGGPRRVVRSMQSVMWAYNPLSTLVSGVSARWDHWRFHAEGNGWFARWMRSPARQRLIDVRERFWKRCAAAWRSQRFRR